MTSRTYDLIAIGAHPDDAEAVIGGTLAKLVAEGKSALIVDLCDGEPTRHGIRGERAKQAARAAEILGADRVTLPFPDRMIQDTIEARLQIARLIRIHNPRMVFGTLGSGVHPDHKAATDIITNGVFYARLPKWEEIPEGKFLAGTEPHEIERLFFGHCRMEPPMGSFDFAIDVTSVYQKKLDALLAYEAVFQGDQATLLDKYTAEDRYFGSLAGVRYAEVFKARSPVLLSSPSVILKSRFG